jgi:hypothetical protein
LKGASWQQWLPGCNHPLTQESIGYAGMADYGWQTIGLDEHADGNPVKDCMAELQRRPIIAPVPAE